MALVHYSTLSPELRLAQALSNFEAQLSIEQKTELSKCRSQDIPSIDDVMRLTAEIDRHSITRTAEARRCYGPRMTNFLQGVQQFARVADIAVGGSQIPVASGAWTVVRFLLLAGCQASNPYVDKLSELFMTLGRSVPRHQEIAILYPRSKHLQNALFEYYIVIIEMCCEIIKLSKSNGARCWTAFSGETYTHKLDRCASNITNEVFLENARVTKAQTSKIEQIKVLSRRQLELQKSHRSRVLKKRLLDACSTHDYQTTWKQARKSGTTLLYNDSNAYQEWKQSQSACNLVYSGALGSGKTVLLANIVDDLYLQQDFTSRIAYFFCRYDLPTSMTARTIVGCLTRQLIQHYSDVDTLLIGIDLDNPLSIEDLSALIKKIDTTTPIHFILDGYDDCTPTTQQDVISSLRTLQACIPLLICIATRVQGDILTDSTTPSVQCLSANIPVPNPDINDYTSNKIDEQLRLGNLIVRNPELVETIKNTLQSQANGMFLWVQLQIVCLSFMENDHDIQEALKILPAGLSETYCRLLKLHDKSRYRTLLFELILVALEPLTLTQLEHALSVEVGNTHYNPEKILNSIDKVVRACAGMIVIDEEEETARFVHHSARQFLTSPIYDKQIDQHKAQTTMAEVILTYLNYDLFETRIAIRHPATTLTIGQLPTAMLMTKMPFCSKLLQRAKLGASRNSLSNIRHRAPIRQTEFKNYAEIYWDAHLMCVKPSALSMEMLSGALAKERLNQLIEQDSLVLLKQAITNRRTEVLSVFLRQGIYNEHSKEAFKCAAQLDDSSVVDVLVKHYLSQGIEHILAEAIINDCPAIWTALIRAESGLFLVNGDTQILLNKSFKCMRNLTPLMFAIAYRSNRMVDCLLKTAAIDIWKKSRPSVLTPLEFAVARGYLYAVELLAPKSTFDQWKSHKTLWKTALESYEQPSSVELPEPLALIKILISNNCYRTQLSPGSQDSITSSGRTPLMMAAQKGLYPVVEILLECDSSNINTRMRHYRSNGGDMESPNLGGIEYDYYETAWDLASNKEIKSLLERYGGKPGLCRRVKFEASKDGNPLEPVWFRRR